MNGTTKSTEDKIGPAQRLLASMPLNNTMAYSKSYWGARIIAAEFNGLFNEIDRAKAAGWTTCACGKVSTSIPVDDDIIGRPLDPDLATYGFEFNYAVKRNDFLTAAAKLICIEERAKLLPGIDPFRRTEFLVMAEKFAMARHGEINHVRKYTGDPYINHPRRVVEILKTVYDSPRTAPIDMVCAAWLHDTVEDTNTIFDEINALFGPSVVTLVDMLTDVSKPEDGNRKTRKNIDLQHTAKAHDRAKTIKLADLIDNAVSIIEHDSDFAKIYMVEMEALLKVLDGGEPFLMKVALEILNEYKRSA